MRDEHLSPLLLASSEAELALLIEFLGRPPSGLLWLDRRIRDPAATHAERVDAVVAEILRCGSHTIGGRLGGGKRAYVQIVCDALQELELPETPAQSVRELELRVVHYVLDSEFDRLPPARQQALVEHFFAGEFFVGGLHGYDLLHPLMTRSGPDGRKLSVGKIGRTMRRAGGRELRKRAQKMVTKAALKLVLRSFAGPVTWGITAWELLGAAYRLTVPVICYVAYLRHKHPEAGAATQVGAAADLTARPSGPSGSAGS
ncbi:MAG: hypothetical protein H0T76_14225 [Nannocystis sp.]|nr:hypothetical protein [Nannocystis sp.]MBA3547637.1 hypothetical protein [Nannocystis sp.]